MEIAVVNYYAVGLLNKYKLMFLEKLEIQGFKSFANKNILLFPGMLNKSKRGITAIVGPNGSGKSNVADAVRWALGEQSMKVLRGKKSEDIIFSGSDKKGKLGMAEVLLYLNNEDKTAPLDYSQIVIARRLFRNGESEYLINNNRVRLIDVQMLLAKAKFGQKTYSVIGQGIVEGFLNTTLAERKEFFDEATGVKQFQIKRDDSLNKLRNSYNNLNQAQMLLNEIQPRLNSLTRQFNKLQKREGIETELKNLQLKYYGKTWHEINDKFNSFNNRILDIEKIKLEKEKKVSAQNRELEQMENKNEQSSEFTKWQKMFAELQNTKENITKQMARLDAQLEVRLEAKGQFDLSWLNNKKEELAREVENIEEEVARLNKNIGYEKERAKELEQEKEKVDIEINNLNDHLLKLTPASDNRKINKIKKAIKKSLIKLEQASQETGLNKFKEFIKEIESELKQALLLTEEQAEKEGLDKIQQKLIKFTKAKEKIITKINENNLRITARSERAKLLNEKKDELKSELADIEHKIKQNQKKFDSVGVNTEKQKLKNKIAKLDQAIREIKEKINDFNAKKEKERARLFVLQKNIQNLQNQTNDLNEQLSELKINSTRFETKLEDLEIEIRHNLQGLKEVKQYKIKEDIDIATTLDKINQLKRQLMLIGGIDREIEKEYQETKERYDFLNSQVNDLTKAIESLEKIIKELDLTIKEKFDKEFKVIANKFEEYFKILFNGGQAKIIKVMDNAGPDESKNNLTTAAKTADAQIEILNRPQNSLKSSSPASQNTNAATANIAKFLQKHNATGLAGIEIQAIPPGKKIKSIAMLSGGERALTAIALICAIISANPSPFVVLDEVDAALDEANSERFAKILDDLSYKTQFILITHNRASMRRANILYGITMRNDGVSKLLSVKLDEVKVD